MDNIKIIFEAPGCDSRVWVSTLKLDEVGSSETIHVQDSTMSHTRSPNYY
jgi:hypothetical protein